jgi:catechol 2,3-dioxygenase-like lactoylglutathione lyase family enzyme
MRLHHVQVACPPGGEEVARAFYAGALGLREVEKPEDLRARGGACELDAVRRRLEEGGYEVDLGQRDTFPGHERVHTFDGHGNRVELLAARG